MNSTFKIRKAVLSDISFLAETIIEAEKSNTAKLSYSTLFDISEKKTQEYLIKILEEEIDGCEFSLSSFLIVEKDKQPVAAFGAWIEGDEENGPSKILKSNLLSFVFGTETISRIKNKASLISDILIEREKDTIQLEYMYVRKEYRGNKLGDLLIQNLISNLLAIRPKITKAHVQTFGNNLGAIKLYERNGFRIIKRAISDNKEILHYLPDNEKVLLEKSLI